MQNDDLDIICSREIVRSATGLSFPTISRMQRLGRFPMFEPISAGRRGLRRSVLTDFLGGRRDWAAHNELIKAQISDLA